jgi:hypothetical protein
MNQYYRVEQAEDGHERQHHTGATSYNAAAYHMMSMVENMCRNGWWRTDDQLHKRFPTDEQIRRGLEFAVILTNGERVVTLAVVECSAFEVTGTRLELREMEWLTRVVQIATPAPLELAHVNTDDLNTPIDGYTEVSDQYGDGYDVEQEAGVS